MKKNREVYKVIPKRFERSNLIKAALNFNGRYISIIMRLAEEMSANDLIESPMKKQCSLFKFLGCNYNKIHIIFKILVYFFILKLLF